MKFYKYISIVISIFAWQFALAQPANDVCGGALPINPNNGCVNGTTVAANDNWVGSIGCQGGGQNPDVWYSFTATNTQLDYSITTSAPFSGNVEFTLAESSGPCTGLLIRESNCGPSVLSGTVTGIQIGTTYYITVSQPNSGTAGPFQLCINNIAAPVSPGQDCTVAAVLCNSNSFTQGSFSGVGAFEEISQNSCFGSDERQSKWYTFTVGCSGTIGFDIIPTVLTNDYDFAFWNTTAGCYTSGTTMGVPLACNWSGTTGPTGLSSTGNTGTTTPNPCTSAGAADCSTGGGPNAGCQPCTYQNTVVNVVAGQTYTLLVDNFGASGSGFTLNFNGTATIGPDAAFTFTNPSCGVYNFTKTCQTTNSTFLWSFGDGATSTSQNPSHTYTTTGVYTVTLEVTDALGCVRTSSITIDINIPIATATPNPQTICSGSNVAVALTSTVGGTTFSWVAASNANVGGESITPQIGATINNTLTNVTGSNQIVNYTVTPTAAGCTGPNLIVPVTIIPIPTVNDPADVVVCPGQTIDPQDFVSVPAGATFNWTNSNTSIGLAASGTGQITPYAAPANATGSPIVGSITVTPTLSGCPGPSQVFTITINPSMTVTPASSNPTLCANTAISPVITFTTTGATGIGAATGLPAGVSASFSGNTITVSGTPTASGTFNYSIPLTGGCGVVNATGTITVNAQNTIAAGTSPTLCINTAMTTITLATTGATGATFSGLPTGVTGSWAPNAATISGTPSVSGTFNYTVTTTGGCPPATTTGTITVTPNNTVTAASSTPTLCINTAISPNITFTTTGATGIGAPTGLPAGVTASFSGNTITVSGTPTASGTFNYSIPLTGGCGVVNATGTITVTPLNTVTAASSTPTLCVNTAISPVITFTTTGATGIGAPTGLPAGVTASFSGNTITVSGTPTGTGTFNYTIPLSGGCGTVSATGTITVVLNNTVTAASSNPTLCINTVIAPDITFTTTGATGIGAPTGLPAGVTANFAGNTITVSGTPTASGTFNYSIPLTGGCGAVNATGTITVTPNNTVTAASSNPSVCIGSAITSVTFTTTGATGIGAPTGLPAGVTASWFGNTITVSGTPSATGTFNYSIPLTGGCGVVNATGTIVVNAIPVISLTPTSPNTCNATDGSILVSGTGTGNVVWTGPTSSNANGVSLNYNITGLGAGTYDVYFVDGNGCQSATEQASLVNPGAPVLDIINDITNCGTSYSLPTIGGTSLNAPAYYDLPGGPTGGGSVIAVGTTYNAPTNITLYAYDENGACNDEEPFTITINEIPTVNDPSDVLVCPTVTIDPQDFVSVPAGATFNWTNTNIAIGLPGSGSGQITPYAAPANATGATVSGDITVTPVLNGCTGASQVFTISISPTPTVNDPADVTVCPGATIDPQDFASVPAGATFAWVNSNTANGLLGSGSGQITPYAAPANATGSTISGNITVTPTLNGCSGPAQVFVISVSPTPVITLTPNSPSTCNGTNGSVLVSGSGSGTVTWSGTASGSDPAANLNYSIPNLGAGNYDVFFIDGTTGCQSATESTVLINPGAPTLNAIAPVNNCGTAYTLSAISGTNTVAPQYYTATGGPSGGGSIVSVGTTYNAPTNITLYAYDENGSCNDEVSFTILINPLPTVTAVTGGNTYCAGDVVANITADVTGNGPWDVTYTVDGGAPQTASGAASPIVLGNGPGVYVVTDVTDANCTNTASGTQTITINALPTVTAVTGGNTYCTGDVIANITADVTGLGPWDVTYTVDGGAPQTASGASTPIVLGNGPGVYVVTNVTDANCTNTASGTQTITINTLPTVTSVTGGDVYCAGDVILDITVAVTGNGPWDVTYTIDGGAPQTASGASSPIVLGNGPGVYVVTNVTDANCTNTASGTQTITINTLPTVTAVNGGASYCPGDTPTNITVDVTGAPSWTVTYTIDGGAPQTAIGSTSPFALDDLPGVYVVTAVTDANCANTASGTQTITMNPTPVITLTPADPNACNATDGSVLVSGTGSGTVTWSGQASGTDAAATLNYTIPNLGAGNYSVYFIDGATGCQSTTESTSLNNPGAPVLNNPGPQTACDSYALPVITGTGLVNESYWTGTGGTGTQLSAGSAITSTQTVYIYDVNGSCSDEESFVVTINNTPAITNPGDQTACSSYTLGAIAGTNISAGAAYYDDSQVNSGVQVTGPITSTQTVWIFDANGGCSDETSFVVTINPLPTVTGVNGSGTYCAGDAITDITAVVTGTGPWTVDYTLDGAAMSANGATSPVVLGNTAGTYVVTNVTDANCTNTASGTQNITVNPIPGAPTAGNDSTYCSSWTLAPMTATGGNGTMTWYDDAALTGVITTGGSLTPFDTDGTTVYYVTETAVGCEGPASMVTITIQNCDYTIPTAITPNGDGVHDDWEIYGLDAAYPNNVVRIYNRWGGLLYEHDSSANGPYDDNRWKGDYNNEPLPVGSYYYIIELNDEDKKVESGAVSILLEK